MKLTKLLSPLALMIFIGLTASGCVKKGAKGDPGANSGISTVINCQEVIFDSPGDELHVEYETVILNNGDRYSSATLLLSGWQSSKTVFHSANDSKVRFGQVSILEDIGLASTPDHNYGTWHINFDLVQQKLNIIYNDPDVPLKTYQALSTCTIKSW